MTEFSDLLPNEKNEILALLRTDPAKHALALQNLAAFPAASKFFFTKKGGTLSYLHVSGHPAHSQCTTLVLDGASEEVESLLREFRPQAPFVVRESPASTEGAVKAYFPGSKCRREHRMDVNRSAFRPRHSGKARQLEMKDLPALCSFVGAPPQAAPRFEGWLRGAKVFFGIEEGGELRAIGSSMVCLPEIYNVVSIETHKEHRGKGYGTELTSALVAKCLEHTHNVCLTVFGDNEPALKLYKNLGFRIAEERVWIDCGK